jgi:hypothetical protein
VEEVKAKKIILADVMGMRTWFPLNKSLISYEITRSPVVKLKINMKLLK